MWRPAVWAGSGRRGLLQAEDPLDLRKFRVRLLQPGGVLDEHVDSNVVAHGHLVCEAAEIPLELGNERGELVPPAAEVEYLTLDAGRGPRGLL